MNTFIESISPRNLKENTVKVYVSNLRKLTTVLTGHAYVNPDFFMDSDLTEYISQLSDSKKRIVLSTILLALSPSEKNAVTKPIYKDTYDKYKDILWKLNKKYMNQKSSQTKNSKELDNWLEWNQIKKFQKKLKRQMKGYNQKSTEFKKPGDLQALKRFLVISLYYLQPPRRLEFGNMKILNFKDYEKLDKQTLESNNYLVIKNTRSKFFSYGDVKSHLNDLPQIVQINTDLNGIINMYLSLSNIPNAHSFLYNSRGGDENPNSLSKYLTKTFQDEFDKNISSNMLRHIFLSNLFKSNVTLKHRTEVARQMNHSIGIQESVYVKLA